MKAMAILLALMLVGELASTLFAGEAGGGAADEKSKQTAAVPSQTKEKLHGLLPDANKLGLEAMGQPTFYGTDLYEYINGAADAFHMYDFAALIHQDYTVKEAAVTLDIYDMGKTENAFGMYASERSAESDFLLIGAEGYGADWGLNFCQGPYYVKMSVLNKYAGIAGVLEALAQGVSDRIKTGKSLPDVFALFPTENKKPHGEKFVRRAPLGHEFLAPAYMATYAPGGKESNLVLSQTATEEQAREQTRRLEEHFRKSGKVSSAPGLGSNAFLGSSRYEGEVLFVLRGVYTVLLINPTADGEAFLKSFLVGLGAGKDESLPPTFTNTLGMEFVLVPAGSFVMGTAAPTDDPSTERNEHEDFMDSANRDELPLHKVSISRPFYIGKYEVTQEEWSRVMGDNPSHFKEATPRANSLRNPVENVSWQDVQKFIERLNSQDTTSTYRLPTEPEWEYACRAGTTGDFAGRTLRAVAWYDIGSSHRTHPVGTAHPNAWELYDMHGNVWEWCQNWYDKNYYPNSPETDPQGPPSGTRKVIRGGGIYDSAEQCRSAYRGSGLPDDRNSTVGFRLLRMPKQ